MSKAIKYGQFVMSVEGIGTQRTIVLQGRWPRYVVLTSAFLEAADPQYVTVWPVPGSAEPGSLVRIRLANAAANYRLVTYRAAEDAWEARRVWVRDSTAPAQAQGTEKGAAA